MNQNFKNISIINFHKPNKGPFKKLAFSTPSVITRNHIDIKKNKYFIFLSFTAIQNQILQQTKIPITIPYRYSINI